MAYINLYDIYGQKRRKFGVNDSSTFQESFVDAVNLAFSEFNAEVFQASTLDPLGSFKDVIDQRLDLFTTITFDSDCESVMSNREYWAVEYAFERKSATNTFTDTITDGASNVVVTISNGLLTIAGDTLAYSVDLPDVDNYRILISSNKSGNRILINDEEMSESTNIISLDDIPDLDWIPDLELIPTHTLGDSTTTQKIGTVTARVISGITGLSLRSTAFYSSKTKLLNFDIDEGTGTALTDSINSYTATVVGEAWRVAYIEDSCVLDKKYSPPFSMAVEYHLQDGGQWAIEPDGDRERKWYGRGVPMAREIYRQNTTYQNPLGIS